MPIDKNQKDALLNLIREAVNQDKQLREDFKIGDKFRFIRDRLNALEKYLEENLSAIQEEEKKGVVVSPDETLVYIHLFNAQGTILQSWQKMLGPGVYYEYSINRPIYMSKSDVEAFIKSRPNRQQHGYLTVAVPKVDVLKQPDDASSKDSLGHPLTKVREGSLKANRMVAFTYNGQDYVLDNAGQLIKEPVKVL